MDGPSRARIDKLIQFHADLTTYARGVELYDQQHRLWARQSYGQKPEMTPELEALRQDLLRRSGPVRTLFGRIIGNIVQPGPFQTANHDAWDIALVGHRDFYSGTYVKLIADHLLTIIGRLEDDPSLLDPPKPRNAPPDAAPGGRLMQTIHVHPGAVANIGQTAAGNISQTAAQQQHQDIAEVRALLAELLEAIREIEASDDEVEGFLEPVEHLDRELKSKRPLVSRLTTGWSAVQGFAAIEGAWQGWDRVQRLSEVLGPKLHDVIQALVTASS